MTGLCPNCRGSVMAPVRSVAFCRGCDQRNGVQRPPATAVRTTLRCGKCEHQVVQLGAKVVPVPANRVAPAPSYPIPQSITPLPPRAR